MSFRSVSGLLTRAKARLEADARLRYATVGIAFLGLVLADTWPWATHFGSGVIGAPGDEPTGIRLFWSLHAQHSTPFTATVDRLIAAPEGVPITRAVYVANFIYQGFTWFGGELIGWAAAYNVFDLAAFASAGLAAYVLFERLGAGALPAAFGALVFAFNPNHVEKAYSSAPLAATATLALALLALVAHRRRRSPGRAAWVGASILLAFYIDTYLGLFAAWIVVVFFVVDVALPFEERRWAVATSYYVTALVSVFGLIPAAWGWLANSSAVDALSSARSAPLPGGFASWQLFLLPGPRQPLTGGATRAWLSDHLSWEGTMFVGYTTIVLAVAGVVGAVIAARRRQLAPERAFMTVFAFVLVLTSIWAALPPSAPIPVLQQILAHFTTLFRVFSRFGTLVDLGVLVLAVHALSAIRKWPIGRHVAVVAILVVGFELYVPLPKVVSVRDDLTAVSVRQIGQSLSGTPTILALDRVPDYTHWLARQPDGIVADYPSPAAPDLSSEWKNAFYQTVHHHPLWQVTGISNAPQDPMGVRETSADLSRPRTPTILGAMGVRFVVAHLDEYRRLRETRPPAAGACGLAVARTFPADSVIVYRVTAPSAPWSSVGDGLQPVFDKTAWPESRGYRWIAYTVQLTIYAPRAARVQLRGSAVSFRAPRQIKLIDSTGGVVGIADVPAGESAPFALNVDVHEGFNLFTITASPGPVENSRQMNRRMSVALRGIDVTDLSAGGNAARPGCG